METTGAEPPYIPVLDDEAYDKLKRTVASAARRGGESQQRTLRAQELFLLADIASLFNACPGLVCVGVVLEVEYADFASRAPYVTLETSIRFQADKSNEEQLAEGELDHDDATDEWSEIAQKHDTAATMRVFDLDPDKDQPATLSRSEVAARLRAALDATRPYS